MMIRYKFSGALLRARTERQLTQEKAAEILGISTRWLQKIEKGTSQPNLTVTCRIVKEFNINLAECVPDEEDKD